MHSSDSAPEASLEEASSEDDDGGEEDEGEEETSDKEEEHKEESPLENTPQGNTLGGHERDRKEDEEEEEEHGDDEAPEEAANGSATNDQAEAPEVTTMVASSDPVLVLLPDERDGDEEFNQLRRAFEEASHQKDVLQDRLQQIQSLVSGSLDTSGNPRPPPAPLPPRVLNCRSRIGDDFFVIMACSSTYKGKKLVPGGRCNATRLSTSSPLSPPGFPHVLAKTMDDDGQFSLDYLVQTERPLGLAVSLHRKPFGEPCSEMDVLRELNRDSNRDSLERLDFSVALKMDCSGDFVTPYGCNETLNGKVVVRTFERNVRNDATGRSQLLVPDEASGYYTGTRMFAGRVRWTTTVRAGATSFFAIPKHTKFIFEATCVTPGGEQLKTQSVPFYITSRFRRGDLTLAKAEMYTQDEEGDTARVCHRSRPVRRGREQNEGGDEE